MDLLPFSEFPRDDHEALLDAAFGADRLNRAAYAVRAGLASMAALSASMVDGRQLVGSIQCFAVALLHDAGCAAHAPTTPLIMVGPIAVHPDRQNQGIGRAMLRAMLDRMDASFPQMLVGDAPYYAPFGFSAEGTAGWRMPGSWDPARLLARGLPQEARKRSGLIGPPPAR